MGFSIVHGSPQTVWVPVDSAETIYNGSVVAVDSGTPLEGVRPLPVAAGASNVTNKDIPFGVVVGNNNVTGNIQFSSTYNTEYITQVAAGSIYGSTKEFRGVEGVWAKGDPQAFVEVAIIDPLTVLRAPLWNGAVGTAMTEATVSTASGGDGIGCTSGAVNVATVANFSTIYCRSGANKGIYRQLDSASTTAHTWDKAMKADVAIGDKIVAPNLNMFGLSRMQIDSEAQYIDIDAAVTTNYFYINVLRLDLSEAGAEFVEFQFNAENFCPTVAA
jgi:hypothetical protein